MRLTSLDPWIRCKISPGQPSLSLQELQAWQLDRLNETLALVRARSAFYRGHLEGTPGTMSHLQELRRLPFTRPDDLRDHPLRFLCVSQSEIQRVVTLPTSGTTGAPKRVFFTTADQELTVDFFGVGMSTLTKPGERVLILLPGQTPGSVGDLLRLGLARLGRVPLPYGILRDPLHALETMHAQQPDCLVGSPVQVLGLARRWVTGKKAPLSVLLSTDYVPEAIVRILEDTWGCRVFNHYGATEMGLGGGVECDAHLGYHLRESDLYFEIIHPQSGEPVPDGEYGEVVFTTLNRHGMPLVRYRTGDRSRFLPGACPCGTALRRMERVRGRMTGFIRVGNEVLSLPDLDEALFPLPDLLNFSAVLTGEMDRPVLNLDIQMLTGEDRTSIVEQALQAIPALKKIRTKIRCDDHPEEPGNMVKRVLIDHRRPA